MRYPQKQTSLPRRKRSGKRQKRASVVRGNKSARWQEETIRHYTKESSHSGSSLEGVYTKNSGHKLQIHILILSWEFLARWSVHISIRDSVCGAAVALLASGAHAVQADRVCPQSPDIYREMYESSHDVNHLICYQEAMQRRLNPNATSECPESAQYYRNAYQNSGSPSDLICFDHATQRERRPAF